MKKTRLIFMAILSISGFSNAQTGVFPISEPPADFQSLSDEEMQFNLMEVNPEVQPFQSVFFEEISSVSSGEWSEPSTWDCNCIPGSTNSVTINAEHTVTVNEDKEIFTLLVELDGQLTSTSEDITLTILGDIALYGAMDFTGIHFRMNGIENQVIYGNCNVDKFYLAGNNEVSVDGNLFISEELWIGSASLITNGRVYLQASGRDVAEVAPIFDGEIIGDVNISKNISITQNGWISLGTPTSDATIETIVDDFLTTGFPGADYPNYDFMSVSYYVEESDDLTSDFVGVSSSTDPMVVGRGYYVYGTSGNYTFNVTGELNQGEIDLPVTFNDNLDFTVDGRNLISNPYPATINWDSETGWVKENMLGAIYVWDVSQKQFRTYINGIGVNGGSAFIRPTESFWVFASDFDPTLSINETAKALHVQTTQSSENDMLISIFNEQWSDELVITTHEDSSTGFDPALDALKLNGDNSVPNISVLSEDDIKLAINNMPTIEDAYDIQLVLDNPVEGDYTLSFDGVMDYVDNRCISVEDVLTGQSYDLMEVTEFTFNSAIVEDDARFIIHVGAPVSAFKDDVACANETTGRIETLGSGDGPWNYSWFDADMNLLGETLEEESSFMITGLAAGDYYVRIENNDFCNALTMDVIITEPELELLVEEFSYGVGCNEENTGELYLNIEGGVEPYDVAWNNDMEGYNIEELPAGTYNYSIVDAAGCSRNGELEVVAVQNVQVSFETMSSSVSLDENGEALVTFVNNSTGTTNYIWNFGDSSDENNMSDPTHVYTTPGFYTVSLFAENESCDDYYQAVVVVEDYTGVNELSLEENLTIISANGEVALDLNSKTSKNVLVEVYDLLGKRLSAVNGTLGNNQRITVPLNTASSLYIISVTDIKTGEKTMKKVLKA